MRLYYIIVLSLYQKPGCREIRRNSIEVEYFTFLTQQHPGIALLVLQGACVCVGHGQGQPALRWSRAGRRQALIQTRVCVLGKAE